MSEVYTTGNMYNKRYWSPEKETRCFIEFWQLKWSEDFVNEKGVMFLSGQIVRVKKKRHLFHKEYGLFSKHDDPSNPVTIKRYTTPSPE